MCARTLHMCVERLVSQGSWNPEASFHFYAGGQGEKMEHLRMGYPFLLQVHRVDFPPPARGWAAVGRSASTWQRVWGKNRLLSGGGGGETCTFAALSSLPSSQPRTLLQGF